MKYCSTQALFNVAWDQFAIAFWNKYPNPFSTHVLSEDVIERRLVDGKLYTKRLLSKCSSKLPKHLERFVPKNRIAYILEESIIDVRNQKLISLTRNMNMRRIMAIDELCEYSAASSLAPTPSASSFGTPTLARTVCEKQTAVSSGVYGFSRPIENFGTRRYLKNAQRSNLGLHYVLDQMFPDTTNITTIAEPPTNLPAWKRFGSKARSEWLVRRVDEWRKFVELARQRAEGWACASAAGTG